MRGGQGAHIASLSPTPTTVLKGDPKWTPKGARDPLSAGSSLQRSQTEQSGQWSAACADVVSIRMLTLWVQKASPTRWLRSTCPAPTQHLLPIVNEPSGLSLAPPSVLPGKLYGSQRQGLCLYLCDHSSGLRSASTSMGSTCVQENTQRNRLLGKLEILHSYYFLSYFLQRVCFLFFKDFFLMWTIFSLYCIC